MRNISKGILVGCGPIWLLLLLAWLFGCTPHTYPIDVSAERVDEVPQRVHTILTTNANAAAT